MQRTTDGRVVLERLEQLPGGSELIALAQQRNGGVELVGGAVRDIMLGARPRELDVIVDRDVESFASALATQLGGELTLHERFATAMVRSPSASVDLATVRAESYPSPGALPEVCAGTPAQDLARRDFTVNAIAVELAGKNRGVVRALAGALEDLAGARLRVLHDASFRDDPTRILRLARYTSRLAFQVERHTAGLAAEALAAGALQTVSGPRLGAELRLAFAEPQPVVALVEMDRLGVLAAWDRGLSFDAQLASAALEILPPDGSPEVLLAASLLLELAQSLTQEATEPTMRGFLLDLELPSGAAERAFSTAVSARFVAERIDCTESTEAMLELVGPTPVESLALAGALRDLQDGPASIGRGVIERWLGHQRHMSLQIGGDDLIAAGVPEGPEIGRRLDAAYALRLEGLIEDGREAELRAALKASI